MKLNRRILSGKAGRLLIITMIGGYLLLLWASHLPSPGLLKNPDVYTGAFHDAVMLALSDHLKHKDYYRYHLDDLKTSAQWSRGPAVLPRGLCTIENLEKDGIDRADPCQAIRAIYIDECRSAKGCALFRVDTSILRDQELKAVISSALADPCRSVLRPADIDPRLHGMAVPGLHFSVARFPWGILRCDGGTDSFLNYLIPFRQAQVTGKVTVDEQAGIIRVRFNAG